MKVLFDHQIFQAQKFGGISRYFSKISNLKYQGVDTEIIDHHNFQKVEIKKDILSKGIRFSKRKMGIDKPKDKYPSILTNRILRNDFDIFHPTYYDSYFLKYLKRPFVLTVYDMIHEIYPEYMGINDKTSELKKELCQKADAIIAISETTKVDLIEILKIDESKITTTFLGSGFDKVAALGFGQNEDLHNYILFTGNRSIYKNFYFMVNAIAEFLLNDKTLKLVCTGKLFTEKEVEYFKARGIEDSIIHIYAKSDGELAWLYQNARCFIFPSLYEGFGIPILEAFASQCPVISSTGGSLKEIGGKGVKYFDPKNQKELKIALSDVLFNKTTREALVKNGIEEFQKYSWDKCRDETLNVYKSVM